MIDHAKENYNSLRSIMVGVAVVGVVVVWGGSSWGCGGWGYGGWGGDSQGGGECNKVMDCMHG